MVNLRCLINLGLVHGGGWRLANLCERRAQLLVVNIGTTSRALPTRMADFNPLHVGNSVQKCPGLEVLRRRINRASFNSPLVPRRGGKAARRGVECLSDESHCECGIVADGLAELRSDDGAVGE